MINSLFVWLINIYTFQRLGAKKTFTQALFSFLKEICGPQVSGYFICSYLSLSRWNAEIYPGEKNISGKIVSH
jgi:hypothetical protein